MNGVHHSYFMLECYTCPYERDIIFINTCLLCTAAAHAEWLSSDQGFFTLLTCLLNGTLCFKCNREKYALLTWLLAPCQSIKSGHCQIASSMHATAISHNTDTANCMSAGTYPTTRLIICLMVFSPRLI